MGRFARFHRSFLRGFSGSSLAYCRCLLKRWRGGSLLEKCPAIQERRVMMRAIWLASAAVLAVLVVPGGAESQEAGTGPRTVITPGFAGGEGEWVLPTESTMMAPYFGREALWVRNGQRPYRSDIDFVEGTIEFDVAPMPGAVFVGVTFRRLDRDNYETVFFRPGKNGAWDALQYMPRTLGSSQWQLYPGFQAVTALPGGEWTHVRIEVVGDRMELFVGGSSEPTLVVAWLRGMRRAGTVGFWARTGGDTWAAAYSNVKVTAREAEPTAVFEREWTALPGTISYWEIAGPPVSTTGERVLRLPDLSSWSHFPADADGVVNVSRMHGQPPGRNTVFLRHRIEVSEAVVLPLDLSYSDEISVFLDGAVLFSGLNSWQSRYPGYLGGLRLGIETVHLGLAPGSHDLVLALTDEAGGWGLTARFPEATEEGGR
jgi:hypothetical protein